MRSTPLVVAHRGASGYRPEHTLEAYRLAIALGADFIEPDLVVTADGVLVARHENELSATTDVADRPEFAARRSTKEVAGRVVTGWFVEDFTAAELRRLRARERDPALRQRNRLYDGRAPVPTLTEIVDLARSAAARLGRPVGVYPETKLAGYFARLGLPHEDALLAELERAGPDVPVFIQSFEPWILHRLARRTSYPLVQLVDVTGSDHAGLITPNGLREVATYAQVLGAHKSLLIPRQADDRLAGPSGLDRRAREAGLAVHAWTFRNENAFLPTEYRRGRHRHEFGDAFGEYAAFLRLDLAAVFTDHPDTAVAARAATSG
jgi:glycerophosphoryl diester phosphodiesterase